MPKNRLDDAPHILYLTYHLPMEEEPGAFRPWVEARLLRESGFRVTVITSTVQYMTGKVIGSGTGWCREEMRDDIRILRVWAIMDHRRVRLLAPFWPFATCAYKPCRRSRSLPEPSGVRPSTTLVLALRSSSRARVIRRTCCAKVGRALPFQLRTPRKWQQRWPALPATIACANKWRALRAIGSTPQFGLRLPSHNPVGNSAGALKATYRGATARDVRLMIRR